MEICCAADSVNFGKASRADPGAGATAAALRRCDVEEETCGKSVGDNLCTYIYILYIYRY
jgi:hypothetical protein